MLMTTLLDAVLRGQSSHAKVWPFAGPREYLYFSVTLTAIMDHLPTDLVMLQLKLERPGKILVI